jgi:5-methylcytosine-specific restriction endonuclease McrA
VFTCRVCGAPLPPKRTAFCSMACRSRSAYDGVPREPATASSELRDYYRLSLRVAYERKLRATPKGQARAKRRNYRRRALEAALEPGHATLTTGQWEAIQRAQGGACLYCERTDRPLTQEHVTPISQGGHHTAANVVAVCGPCNSRRRDRPAPAPGAWVRSA